MHSGRKSAFVLKLSGKITMWNLPDISLKSLLLGLYLLSKLFAASALWFICSVVHLAT